MSCECYCWPPRSHHKRVTLVHLFLRGDVSDYVLMEGRGFGFVTFADPTHAQSFLEVCEESVDFS